MASKFQLNRQVDRMSFIWNVSQHVGDNISCPNLPTDVNLVKVLIGLSIKARPFSWLNSSLKIPLLCNGQMDTTLAYWIRAMRPYDNVSHSQAGIISPARGASYGSQHWSIVRLNAILKVNAPNVWQDLPNHPNVNDALRNELQ